MTDFCNKAYFTVFTGKDEQFYFNLKAPNHEIILQSEGYKSKQGAINGVESVHKNCVVDANYDKKIAKNGEWYFVLKAQNREIIGVSETYSSKRAMLDGVEDVKKYGISKIINGTDKTLYEIIINGIVHFVKPGNWLGVEILKLGGFIGPRFCLFLLNPSGHRKEIRQNESVEIKNCSNFQVIRND